MGRNEIIIIALVVVLLFGAPKLPQMARAIGKSMRILKDETKSLSDDDKKTPDGAEPVSDSQDKAADTAVDPASVDDERRDKR